MPNFYISLDEKFDELISKAKVNENMIYLNEIISLKSFIYDIYMRDNEFENELDYYITLNKDVADENNENNEISKNFITNIIIIAIITYAILTIS